MSNPVMQFQMISKAPEETARFYSSLFGWKVDADNPMGYRQIHTGSAEGIQGGIWPAPPQATNFVQLFMSVEDVRCVGGKGARPRRQGPDPPDHAARGRRDGGAARSARNVVRRVAKA